MNMMIKIENEDNISAENFFVETNHFAVDGFYGLTYFELSGLKSGQNFKFTSKEEFFEAFAAMEKMKEEIERLEEI